MVLPYFSAIMHVPIPLPFKYQNHIVKKLNRAFCIVVSKIDENFCKHTLTSLP